MTSEANLKHLEFIQAVISRLNNNSFLIKGWSITIASAIFVLTDHTTRNLLIVPLFSVPAFWIMDGYYLAVERKFRALYNLVRLNQSQTDFDMTISSVDLYEFGASIASRTIITFHGVLILLCAFLLFK